MVLEKSSNTCIIRIIFSSEVFIFIAKKYFWLFLQLVYYNILIGILIYTIIYCLIIGY